jgi:tetratricopeptide (TPR) repeat protein
MVLLLIAAGSAYTGYRSAIQERLSFQATQVAGDTQAQFDLALQDIQAGRFDLARQRLEYIIQLDPSYPGVAEQLALVLQELRTTATPTFAPTPTLTPTPDLRGRDELFVQAQSLLLSEKWSEAIDTLLVLRKKNPDFMAIKVDGMLFVALRNRGIDKIANEADLEGGTYDLSLAERFGPLDVEAKNWRDWAELYILGASFWDVNWEQAVFYFSELAPVTPNLRDGSGWTAVDRYLLALLGFGDWLSRQGDWCRAQEQYRLYLDMRQNAELEPTAVFAEDQCASGAGAPEEIGTPAVSETPAPPGDLTPSPSPTQETPPPENTPYPSP